MLNIFKVMISLGGHSGKIKKKFFSSRKNQDKISYVKNSYLIKIFDIILPNINPRPEDKSMAKNKQNMKTVYKLHRQNKNMAKNKLNMKTVYKLHR